MPKPLTALVTMMLLILYTAMFGITACADITAVHQDCPVVNGSNTCQAS